MGLRLRSVGALQAILCIGLLGGTAWADPITHQLIVNPIQVSANDGTGSANSSLELFEAEADKIWAQAGIDIVFLDWKYWNSSDALVINSTSELITEGNQQMAGVTNMWFINDYVGAYGAANSGGNRVAIDDSVFSFSGGAGRRDTIAHELGHILGLSHTASEDPLNLMTSGGLRDAVTAIGQITPDGDLKAQLTQEQIDIALSSSYLVAVDPVPEPGTLALVGGGAIIFIGVRRRRKRAA